MNQLLFGINNKLFNITKCIDYYVEEITKNNICTIPLSNRWKYKYFLIENIL